MTRLVCAFLAGAVLASGVAWRDGQKYGWSQARRVFL